MRSRWPRRLSGYMIAVLIAAAWASVVQTQFNLAALEQLGIVVPAALRWQTTGQDLLGFAPVFMIIAVPALAIAFPLAALLARAAPTARRWWFALAGWTALMLAIRIVDALVPPTVLIAATRSASGLAAVAFGGVLAGLAYVRVVRRNT
jgi:hypothetical protein